MSKVNYLGSTLVRSNSTGYTDTIFLPIISDDGPFDFITINEGEFSKYYGECDSISWRTGNYLSNLGYKILGIRHQPWCNKVIKSYESLIKNFTNELSIQRINFYESLYLKIILDEQDDSKNIIFWYPLSDKYNSIPESIGLMNAKITSDLSYNEVIMTNFINNKGVSLRIINNNWVFSSKNKFRIDIGYCVPYYDYTSLRLFSDDIVTAENDNWTNDLPVDAYVYKVDKLSGDVILKFENKNTQLKYFSPNNLKYYIAVREGDIVNRTSVLYTTNYHSYPLKSIDYSNTNSVWVDDDTETTDYSKLIQEIKINSSDQEGVVTYASDSYVWILNNSGDEIKINNYYQSYLTNVVQKGSVVYVGDIIFGIDPSKILSMRFLNLKTYSGKMNFANKYNKYDYFTINLGSINKLVIFDEVYESGYSRTPDIHNKVDVSYYVSANNIAIIPLNHYVNGVSVDYNLTELKLLICNVFKNNGFIVSSDDDYVYFKLLNTFRLMNISNCMEMTLWGDGMYDALCYSRDSKKIITFYSKYPNSLDNIRIKLERNNVDFNYPNIGYNLSVYKYSGTELVNTERFTFDLTLDSEYSYLNINSDIVTILVDLSDDLYNVLTPKSDEFLKVYKNYGLGKISDIDTISGVITVNYEYSGNIVKFMNPNPDIYQINVQLDQLVDDNTILFKSILSNAVIVPGEYVLSRGSIREVTSKMMISNINNIEVGPTDYEVFCDGGIIDINYTKYCWRKFYLNNNLMLFNIDNPEDLSEFPYIYNNYKNASFSYPNIIMNGLLYPNYVSWLLLSLSGDYTGDILVDGLVDDRQSDYDDRIMTIYYDNYRYVLSHNYINGYVNQSFAELLLVLSRIRNYVYYGIDYQLGENLIKVQFDSLMDYIYKISMNSLLKITLDELKVEDRTCTLRLSLYFNHFRVDPINLKILVNV